LSVWDDNNGLSHEITEWDGCPMLCRIVLPTGGIGDSCSDFKAKLSAFPPFLRSWGHGKLKLSWDVISNFPTMYYWLRCTTATPIGPRRRPSSSFTPDSTITIAHETAVHNRWYYSYTSPLTTYVRRSTSIFRILQTWLSTNPTFGEVRTSASPLEIQIGTQFHPYSITP
jgi:hypothetical protein